MEEKGVVKTCVILSEARDERLCAMYFGVSCAFFALKNFSHEVSSEDHEMVCRKLEINERRINELKRIRSEDAKANEKVACIYAAQEQSWFAERRRLQHQIGYLLKHLRILDKQKNDKLYEMEVSLKSKDKMLEEEQNRRKEMEEKVKSVEIVLEEMRETAKRETQDHSAEVLRHKTAFIELVSNYRHLEAELGRAVRQTEAAKQQLEFIFEEREEALLLVEQLSLKIAKMHIEYEKPKRKKSGSRNGRQTLRNMLSEHEEHECDKATRLDEWVHLEAEKYDNDLKNRHELESNAFAEEIQLKDDKLQAYSRKLHNTELESKRLQSQIENLNQDMSELRRNNLKVEVSLLDREAELKTLKDQIALQFNKLATQKTQLHSSSTQHEEEEEEEEELWLKKRDKSQWKVDFHALGVSYKIKRLSQQLLMLDRLAGNQVKGSDFLLMISLLNKQVNRYESLQQKTDNLSERMGEKELHLKQRASDSNRTKEETKTLEKFLQETFQLQRFIVAAGQKLMGIQSKLASSSSGLVEISKELNDGCVVGFDMKRFSDTIQCLFKDVQRGLEVRISRIIGELGGALTCDGIRARTY